MPISAQQAQAELARRELARRAATPSDANLEQTATTDEVNSNIAGRTDLLKRVGQNLQYNPLADKSIGIPERVAKAAMQLPAMMAETVGGVGQHVEDAVVRNSQMGDELKGAGVNTDAGPLEFGDVARTGGFGPVSSAALGLAGSAAIDPGNLTAGPIVGKATADIIKGAGAAARKTAINAGLNAGGIRNAEQLAQLHADRFANSSGNWLKANNQASADLATQIHTDLTKAQKVNAAAWDAFDEHASTLVHPAEDIQKLGQTLGETANKEIKSQKLKDAILGLELRKTQEVAAPTSSRASTIKRSTKEVTDYKLVKDPETGEITRVPVSTRTKGVKASNPQVATGQSQKMELSPGGQEGDLLRETKEQTITDRSKAKGKIKNTPYQVADAIAQMSQGKQMSSRDLRDIEEALGQVAPLGTPESTVAGKLRSKISDFLKSKDPNYNRASGIYKRLSDARDSAKSLYGDSVVNATGLSFSDPSNLTKHFETSAGSIGRNAPQTLEATLDSINGGQSMYASRIKQLAANKGLHDNFIKLSAASIGGALSIAAAKVGIPSPVVGAMMGATIAASSPKATTAAARMLYGNSGINKAVRSAADRYISSPAGRFLQDSGSLDAMKQGAAMTARQAVMKEFTGRGMIQPDTEEPTQ